MEVLDEGTSGWNRIVELCRLISKLVVRPLSHKVVTNIDLPYAGYAFRSFSTADEK